MISVGPYAFQNCTALSSLNLGKGLQTLKYGAFQNCTSLQSVTIPSTLQSADTSYSNGPFQGCTGLTTVQISEGASALGYAMFSGCTKLSQIVIPRSIIFVPDSCSYNCNALDVVYYRGSEAEWNEIKIERRNDPLLKAKKVFNFNGSIDDPTPAQDQKQIYDFVYRCYSEALGRTDAEIQADSEGVMYWYNNLKDGLISADYVGYYFVFSPEGSQKGQSNNNFVVMLYRLYMNRIPDEGGLKYWDDLLNSGTLTRENVNWWFCESAEWQGIKAQFGMK